MFCHFNMHSKQSILVIVRFGNEVTHFQSRNCNAVKLRYIWWWLSYCHTAQAYSGISCTNRHLIRKLTLIHNCSDNNPLTLMKWGSWYVLNQNMDYVSRTRVCCNLILPVLFQKNYFNVSEKERFKSTCGIFVII